MHPANQEYLKPLSFDPGNRRRVPVPLQRPDQSTLAGVHDRLESLRTILSDSKVFSYVDECVRLENRLGSTKARWQAGCSVDPELNDERLQEGKPADLALLCLWVGQETAMHVNICALYVIRSLTKK